MKLCTQDIHDTCRCVLEMQFATASIPVIQATSWKETQIAMQRTYPIATMCIAIDEGFKETIKHCRKEKHGRTKL